MRALLLKRHLDLEAEKPKLEISDLSVPTPKEDEVLIKVSACGLCHTDLDEIEGRLTPTFLPIVLGHQVTGRVVEKGSLVYNLALGSKVGVGWIYSACGQCDYCLSEKENLCFNFKATGKDAHGGYAEYLVAKADFTFPLPAEADLFKTAPLLCAGGVGYRALTLCNLKDEQILAFSGFGSSAHLILKLVKKLYPKIKVFVFARSEKQQAFAKSLKADWAGSFHDQPPALFDAVIDTTPVWEPFVRLLPYLKPDGCFVINAIRKQNTDINSLSKISYETHLWLEKKIISTANATRKDLKNFLEIAYQAKIEPEINIYPLSEANHAIASLKRGNQTGAIVISLI